MATQYLYRIQVQEENDWPAPAVRAWSYADGYDIVPALLREMAACQRPVARIVIELVDTLPGVPDALRAEKETSRG